jgi:hypothetical protein
VRSRKVVPCNYYSRRHLQKPKTKNHTREARMDNFENIIVVLVVDLNCFRSNAQKRLTKDCSDQMCTSWCLMGIEGASRVVGNWGKDFATERMWHPKQPLENCCQRLP